MTADPARSELRVTLVLLALTATTGAVDAVTFIGLGRAFAALATGNVLLLSFGIANAPGIPVAQPAEALGAFIVGVAAAHAVIVPMARRGWRWFVIALGCEVALLFVAAAYTVILAGSGSLPQHDVAIAVVLLAGAMGWRTRAIVEARIPDMPTTSAQVGLAKALSDILSFRVAAEREPRLARARRISTVVGLFAGGLIGALLLRLGPGPALLCVAGFEATIVTIYSRVPRLRPPESPDAGDPA
jgi:uncharacterized membrane protein YoaK (UPF0700 family)